MTDWVWVNFKQMLCDVLGSHDSELIALNSVLVIPVLIDEIDSLRAQLSGGEGACARKPGEYALAAKQIVDAVLGETEKRVVLIPEARHIEVDFAIQEAREVCGEMLRA